MEVDEDHEPGEVTGEVTPLMGFDEVSDDSGNMKLVDSTKWNTEAEVSEGTCHRAERILSAAGVGSAEG